MIEGAAASRSKRWHGKSKRKLLELTRLEFHWMHLCDGEIGLSHGPKRKDWLEFGSERKLARVETVCRYGTAVLHQWRAAPVPGMAFRTIFLLNTRFYFGTHVWFVEFLATFDFTECYFMLLHCMSLFRFVMLNRLFVLEFHYISLNVASTVVADALDCPSEGFWIRARKRAGLQYSDLAEHDGGHENAVFWSALWYRFPRQI